MTCSDCRREMARLTAVAAEELSFEAQAHLGACADCRRRLVALRLVAEPGLLHRDAPAGLAESIIARIAAKDDAVTQVARREKARRRATRLWPVAAAAAAIILAGYLGFGVLHNAPRRSNLIAVTLTLKDPGARSVSVVGDWNGWNPTAQPMQKSDGLWEIELHLKRGQDYQYQFLVNSDNWIPNPQAPLKVPNGFGGVNSVLAT